MTEQQLDRIISHIKVLDPKPGQTVVMSVPCEMGSGEGIEFLNRLKEAFPGSKFLVIPFECDLDVAKFDGSQNWTQTYHPTNKLTEPA